jgi:hypothetical protein
VELLKLKAAKQTILKIPLVEPVLGEDEKALAATS